jgi:hypothetical protein
MSLGNRPRSRARIHIRAESGRSLAVHGTLGHLGLHMPAAPPPSTMWPSLRVKNHRKIRTTGPLVISQASAPQFLTVVVRSAHDVRCRNQELPEYLVKRLVHLLRWFLVGFSLAVDRFGGLNGCKTAALPSHAETARDRHRDCRDSRNAVTSIGFFRFTAGAATRRQSHRSSCGPHRESCCDRLK